MLPANYIPAPPGLVPKTNDAYTEGRQGDRWIRAQAMLKDQPPTGSIDCGRVCVAILDEHSLPTGVFKFGLNPKYSEEGLRNEAEYCEMDFDSYLKCAENHYGEPLKLVKKQAPYIVNVVASTCTCPDFTRRKLHCKHLMCVNYGLSTRYMISSVTGRVVFGIGE